MFEKSAEYYDLIYSFKDYEKEAEDISTRIKQAFPDCKSLLDIACGTGEHHKYLKRAFNVDGLDLLPDFVEIAKKKNPRGQYTVADMADFNLGKTYDAIICMFSSIGYVKTFENTVKALKCFHEHLKENGVLLLEPWITPDKWKVDNLFTRTEETTAFHICRMGNSTLNGNISTLYFHYLVGIPGKVIDYFYETHELIMLTREEMETALDQAGFKIEYDQEGPLGRGLYVARKTWQDAG